MAAPMRERWQGRGDHHGRHVMRLKLDFLIADVHPEAVEHADQRFACENRVGQAVASAMKADNETIPDKLVVPHAFIINDILDAHRRRFGWRGYEHASKHAGHRKQGDDPSRQSCHVPSRVMKRRKSPVMATGGHGRHTSWSP